MLYYSHAGVVCDRCGSELTHYVEEDLGGNLLEDVLLCTRATSGCGLVIPDTAAETVEALSCAS